jgi:hypothetical protein
LTSHSQSVLVIEPRDATVQCCFPVSGRHSIRSRCESPSSSQLQFFRVHRHFKVHQENIRSGQVLRTCFKIFSGVSKYVVIQR